MSEYFVLNFGGVINYCLMLESTRYYQTLSINIYNSIGKLSHGAVDNSGPLVFETSVALMQRSEIKVFIYCSVIYNRGKLKPLLGGSEQYCGSCTLF